MFDFECVTNAVRAMELDSVPTGLSHCQQLELKAKHLGYQSWNHLLDTLKNEPSKDRLDKCTMHLMQRICQVRLPFRNKAYVQLTVLPNNGIGHYSYWIGWDKNGNEVRVPRPIDGREQARKLRKLQAAPIFAIETERELIAWQHLWFSTAMIPPDLAKDFFPSLFNKKHLVEKNPPIDVVKAKYEAMGDLYSNNLEEN
ncbi:TPA: hypothetical protein L5597_002149 [Pseudomonas aeruginosa]|uniref:hypothetical protein n=1 Tax=Pseudomonas TaxID=286 RepID=UPI0003B9995E|nr:MULTISPECIES: hypothetical protein [Pseudomonas]AXL82829.1 hypothetical protein Y89_2310 [Pseudomonas aeruginosa]AXO28267.1 hypothetical protein Ysp71_2314 [Pseudomonas aeruginosa]ELV5910765.1 hypothetical protein [Pseudomonas aeruginosa]ERU45282.1 hypothetical protein Q093_00496 [Pseudomonas aeruginosa CF614]ERV55730.1 hypothetical protein Q065_02420 [Pseudomonas aeruginosa BL11]